MELGKSKRMKITIMIDYSNVSMRKCLANLFRDNMKFEYRNSLHPFVVSVDDSIERSVYRPIHIALHNGIR
jgi:hypothetical protein